MILAFVLAASALLAVVVIARLMPHPGVYTGN